MVVEELKKTITALAPLPARSFDLFLSCAQQKVFARGQCLLDESQVCNHHYFVEKGWLRTYMNREGKDINMSFTFEGNFTANIKSLKARQQSQYIIKAGERSLITLFDKDALWKLYSVSPEIETLCRRILAGFLIHSNEQIAFHKLGSPAERYEYIVKNEPQLIQRVPVTQLSSYLGIARETLSRIRRKKI
jgi:CRP-like cAMP-binding protein